MQHQSSAGRQGADKGVQGAVGAPAPVPPVRRHGHLPLHDAFGEVTGFLKERKRKRDKEKSPLHPSYKERETEVKEKDEKQTEQNTATGDAVLEGFRKECLRHVGQYGQELVEDFYYHWKQVDKKTGKRLFEGKRCFDIFDIDSQLRAWSKSEYTLSKETAALRLERAKGKDSGKQQAASTADQQAIAAKREADNEKLEREIAERKQGAVSYEEWLKMKR